MYGTGHSQSPSEGELREALRLLEGALQDQEGRLRHADEQPADDPVLAALRRSVCLMQVEAERLRELLAPR